MGGETSTGVFWAPGRVNLIGEHTDYAGGRVLPVAIALGVTITGTESAENVLLSSDMFPGEVEVSLTGSVRSGPRWGSYVAAVVAELHEAGRPAIGFRGAISSDLPPESGLSSSAALEVALVTALCAVAGFELEPMEVAQVAQRAELRAVGTPCGIMDQAVSVLARAGHALLLDCATLEHDLVPLPEKLALVIVDSGVRRRLSESAYGQRRAELLAALQAVGGGRGLEPGDVGERSATARLSALAERRLRHFVTENERVGAVASALAGADTAALGYLFAEGHRSLRDDFEVSTAELDLLVEIACASGAVAARMTGAGFGGSIVALVDADDAEAVGQAIVAAYSSRTRSHGARFFVSAAADGAGQLSPR